MNVNSSPVHAGLSRRSILSFLVAAPALASVLAACGDDIVESGSSVAPTGIAHPVGPDDVIVRIGHQGGFVMQGTDFINAPSILISGDGRLITPGVQTMIFPGPLLPAFTERTINEAGIQRVLELAEQHQLLQTPPDYSAEIMVADAPDTIVIVDADGQSFRHQAPALGFETPEKTAARTSLAAFVAAMGDIVAVAGAENLGPEAPLQAEAYRMQTFVVSEADLAGYDPARTQTPWPVDIGVDLANAVECAQVPAATAGTVFTDANQLTFFTQDGTIYRAAVVARLPGDTC